MPSPRQRAYFVEPQAVFAPFFTEVLERAGLEVIRTDSALDLLALDSTLPEVLVLDASDPVVDYEALLSAVRGRVPGLRVLAWADSSRPLFERLKREGVTPISYGLEPADAVTVIRSTLES
jgi:CheY-like chemotaxis protein